MANLTFAVLGMIAVGGGAFGVAWGLKRRGPYELITETPTSKILSLREPGLVELKGAVKRLDRTDLGGTGRGDAEATFRSPLGGREDAVLAAWKVEATRRASWPARTCTSSGTPIRGPGTPPRRYGRSNWSSPNHAGTTKGC